MRVAVIDDLLVSVRRLADGERREPGVCRLHTWVAAREDLVRHCRVGLRDLKL